MTAAASSRAAVLATPLDALLAVRADERGICESRWIFEPRASPVAPRGALLVEACRQVRAYFVRRLRRFDLPLALDGSPFERAVWSAVARLESGRTASYAEIAAAVGRPGAHRAVARAMATAPLALFVPAHRVLGADGRIKGRDDRGMRCKLLRHEGVRVVPP